MSQNLNELKEIDKHKNKVWRKSSREEEGQQQQEEEKKNKPRPDAKVIYP